jgi:ribonuclease HI
MPEKQAEWIAYADGSCIGNPGPGGWGIVLIDPEGKETELAGANRSTTNNRMEITAALEALRQIPPGADVAVHSDSQYVVKTMTLGWKRRENLDLWPLLDAEVAKRRVRWEWVRGHNGDMLNERADELARRAAEGRLTFPIRDRQLPQNEELAKFEEADSIIEKIRSLLQPGEDLRRCKSCTRVFVTGENSNFCSLASCQIRARQEQSQD